jgi:hypothetical protein
VTAHAFGEIVAGYGQRKSNANPDAPTDPVRAHSIDVDDPRAKPGRPIGDGSPRQGWAFKKAQLAAARWLYESQRDEDYAGDFRMQAKFLLIFEKIMQEFLFTASGEFVVSYRKMAEVCRESESTVKRAILVLEYHGFLFHVRRSRRVPDAEGQAAPQRAQAPNAYGFDCEARMSKPVWRVFWSNLMANLKRVEKIAARAAHVIKQGFNRIARPAPRAVSTELRITLARVADAIDRRDAAARATSARPEPGGCAPSVSSKISHYPGAKVQC